jgi:DNA-directed RNA polymerase specialized sigma24 family protein
MASPSPLDRCWMLKDSPESLALLPTIRAAVEKHWGDTQRVAASALGDENVATEIMERAIQQTIRYFAGHPQGDPQDADALLSRFCRVEFRRLRNQRDKLVFIDSSVAREAATATDAISAVDAAVDIAKILADAPPKVREALMIRYGSAESWYEVAAKTGANWQAIRRSCLRYLDHIREKLGIRGEGL